MDQQKKKRKSSHKSRSSRKHKKKDKKRQRHSSSDGKDRKHRKSSSDDSSQTSDSSMDYKSRAKKKYKPDHKISHKDTYREKRGRKRSRSRSLPKQYDPARYNERSSSSDDERTYKLMSFTPKKDEKLNTSDDEKTEKPQPFGPGGKAMVKAENEPWEEKKSYFTQEHDSSDDSDADDELLFDWEQHRYELNQLFFTEEDLIKRGTSEYEDFWKFLKKYQGLQKQKKIREMCAEVKRKKKADEVSISSIFQLPQLYDKRYNINFGIDINVDTIQSRLPPIDHDDHKKRLPRKKLVEMKFIILLYLDFMQKQRFEKLKKLREAQNNLPIAQYREEIVSTVASNNVVIIAGDTGCGKSTQVPQYLLAAGYVNIACTQPRRIACISLSKRVAYETLNEYGSKVGYQIRFEKQKTEHTKIVFLTEGLLLRQVSSETSLSMYDVIILDEIHERHLYTDFLLGVMKCLLMKRQDIKVVLMSATINIDLFQKYFSGKAPVIQVPGRLYPIKLQYFPVPMMDQATKTGKINPGPFVRILQLIDEKYPDDERGDLLMFLSGMNEISTVVEAAKVHAEQNQKWIILPLHSTLSVSEQEKVFDVPPDGVRKCIVSTNIAETSVTIDGVRFVVDSGKVKEMSYDTQSKMRKLKEFWISQASAEQRKGRAGRTGPGTCFRLFSEQEFADFSPYNTPEIQRVPLDSLVLQMISMGLPNVRLFPFIEPPAPEHLENAVYALKAYAAITEAEELTSIGSLLAQLPMDVNLGKMLIMGSLFNQIEPVLSLAAAMSVQSPFTHRAHRDPECVNFIKDLQSDHGDPFTLLAAYREWLLIKQEGYENSRKWCKRRGLEEQRFYEMTKLRHQFAQLLRDSGLQEVAGRSQPRLTGAERAKRSGELRQLYDLKKELYKDGPRKTKVLKLYHGDGAHSDEEDNHTDIKDVDFRIKNDPKQLRRIYQNSTIRSHKDMLMLKIIICSGLYPNMAIADEHNNYKPGSEQLFHTFTKPFTILHPNSVFSSQPEVLQVKDSDIVEMPGFSIRNPLSSKYQLLVYVSLLETHKPYLVDSVRVPGLQLLLLFAHSINTNADMTVIAFDDFIEMKFPDAMEIQNLLFQAVNLRTMWKNLLDTRIQASKATLDDQDNLIAEANKLEKNLCVGLVNFFMTDVLYSMRRLLAADVSVLYIGPGGGDCILGGNPFSKDGKEPCLANTVKGGVYLNEYLTYNSLFETQCNVTTITSYDTICPYCDKELHLTTLERLAHMFQCLAGVVQTPQEEEELDDKGGADPLKKRYDCKVCKKTLWLGIKDIFKHKKECS